MTKTSSSRADSTAICVAAGEHGTTFSLNYLLCGQMAAKSTRSGAPLLSEEQLSSTALGEYPVALRVQTDQVQGLV